ncbi:MAG: hypothetical protein MUF04_11305, partial [Akkermansiaceae bacterium]|nr:hypothetical protein [Akkermansiaceae bacterium]
MKRMPLGRKALLAASLLTLPSITASAETRSVYLTTPGDPYNFLNAGISPGELRGFEARFGAIPPGATIMAVYFSYSSGHMNPGGWGWWVPPGDGSTQGRVDWVVTGLNGTLMLALTDGPPPASLGALPTNPGPNPARREFFGVTHRLMTEGSVVIWADLGGTVMAPPGAHIEQPRFWGYWPYLTIELATAPPPVENGTRNGTFESGNLDGWSAGGGGGAAEVIDGGGTTGKVARLTVGEEGPIYLSQLTAEGVDTGVLACEVGAMEAGSALHVLLDNRELLVINGADHNQWQRH